MKAARTTARVAQAGLLFFSLPALGWAQQPPARVAPGQWAKVARVLGVAGEIRGDVFRVSFAPLTGRIRMGRVRLAQGAIENSWVSFGQQRALGWMMGRLLMPAWKGARITRLLARNGLDVTGETDPLPGSLPAITAVYFRGMGEAPSLAADLKRALGPDLRAAPARRTGRLGRLNPDQIERLLGRRGELDAGALVFRLPRPERVKCCGLSNDPLLVFSGVPLGPATGVESRIAFQPEGTRALVLGRLAVRRGEIGPVERALAVFGIATVSLADPLADEQPRISFLHFFGQGRPLELAQGVRAAIERMHHLPPVTKP